MCGKSASTTMATTLETNRPEWASAKTINQMFGLSRSTLYRLEADGKIRTSSLRERGKLKGKKLFNCDSVAAYIEKMATGPEVGK